MKKIALLAVVMLMLSTMVFAGGAKEVPKGTLVSNSVKTAPTMDGMVDASWEKQPALSIDVVVPDYPYFDKPYVGDKYTVTIKSVHTADEIYFLYQWTGDNKKSVERLPWYFNNKEGKWMQKPKKKADAYYPATYEDKLAVMWAIGDTFPDFAEDGCAVLCHGEDMSTPEKGELIDTWHWKLDRTGPVNQLDDKWLKFSKENGRVADKGTGSERSNSQTIKDANGNDVKVPLNWIPGKKNYNWILASDTAKRKIVKMDSNMNLIDEDGNVLKKEDFSGESPYIIPSITDVKPATGSRGDVAAFDNYDNETHTWTLEVARKISTGHSDDVDFSDNKKTYYFSIAVFDAAAIAHATPGGFAGKAYPMIIK